MDLTQQLDNHHLPAIPERRRLHDDVPNKEETQQCLHRPIPDLRFPSQAQECAHLAMMLPRKYVTLAVITIVGSGQAGAIISPKGALIGHSQATTMRAEAR
jgi:hypothetical protein